MAKQDIITCQEFIGVTADGDFGPETLKRVIEIAISAGIVPKPSAMPWMDIAKRELGQEEVTGGENPRIIEYHSSCTLKAQEDEIPWCSAFVNWCLKQAGLKNNKSAWARSFENYGQKLDTPKIGCIVVFDWGDGSGHVGFVTGWTGTTVTVLGGNQSDSVCSATFSRRQVSAWRWPV